MLAFLGAHAVPGIESWDGDTYRRTLDLPHGAGLVALRAASDGVLVSLWCVPDDAEDALARTTHLCGLDDDPHDAEQALLGDPLLGPLVAARPGLRRPGSVDAAELLVRTVVGQQVSLAGASAAAGHLVARAGSRLAEPVGDLTHVFPRPSALAQLDPASLPMPRSRGLTVVALARALADDPATVDDDRALLALPGVGPWTVDYARFRNRRDPDVLLAGDLAVRRQLEAGGADGRPAAVAALGARWSPQRSTAMMHLWAQYLAAPRARRGGRPA